MYLFRKMKLHIMWNPRKRLKGRQEFILAYTPWKWFCGEDILQVLKALALEYKVSVHDWPTYYLYYRQTSITLQYRH
ncbi:hypothetical protein PHPALM_30610 [Phytophthora palmivora]|uniref:Uncharacterized protein n=1 Tax=Phytophthora palmivora TaxID=4796 RepID=A0A2P4X4R8_9STRA|nr:hypothetical protein PHPALM_30610 [Phytophthora palmivora]